MYTLKGWRDVFNVYCLYVFTVIPVLAFFFFTYETVMGWIDTEALNIFLKCIADSQQEEGGTGQSEYSPCASPASPTP